MSFYVLNILLHVVHLGVILCSVFLWIIPSMRPLHLVLQILILSSWLGIGTLKKDLGFCQITDWQRKWNQRNGRDFPISYMVYIYGKLGLGTDNMNKINLITFGVFTVTTVLSVVLNATS